MNNKVIMGIGIVLIAIVGFLLFYKTPSNSSVDTQNSSQKSNNSVANPVVEESKIGKEQSVVTLTDKGFSPSMLTVKVGTKVTWINKSSDNATVNSDPHPIHTNYSPLNLGSFSNGASLSLTFDKAGTFGYHNHLNPSQKGIIVVK